MLIKNVFSYCWFKVKLFAKIHLIISKEKPLALVDLFNIKKQYDIKLLLDDVDFHLNEGERIAILGQNGCGKSTLMKLITGEEEPSEGRRVVDQSVQIGMMEQQPHFEANLMVREAIENELTELQDAKKEYERVTEELTEDFENSALLNRHAVVSAYLDHHNAWNLDDKVERVLQEFRLKEYEDRPVITLSGGEQRRVALASLILKKPDILLLDEPTNHLDVYMVEFLEEMLLKEKFTLLIISHDRHFIDTIATRVVEVENQKLVSYQGGYQSYLRQKEERMQSMQKGHENLLRLLKQEEAWLSKGVRAREKRNQGRKKRVFELRDEAKKNPTLIHKMMVELEREQKHFNRDEGVSRKKMLFDLEDVCYGFPGKILIQDFTTRILQRDKIAIVGFNGSGKSTLLKLMLGRLQPDSGIIKQGDFSIGYFDQHREMLDDDKRLIETFCPDGGDIIDVQGKNMHVYGYLKSFLFPKEFLDKKNDERAGFRNLADLQMLKMNDCLKATVDDVRVCYSIGYQGIPYETGEDVIKAIRNWHKISGKIDQVHIFSHSSDYAIFGGKEDDLWGIYVNDHQGMKRSEGARFVREIPTDCLADDVIFVLHGCHTADNSKSFAKQLFDHLNKNLNTPKVFGHFGEPGVSANTDWKEFSNGSPNGRKLPGGLPPKIYQPFTINHTNKIMKVRNAYEPYKYPLY